MNRKIFGSIFFLVVLFIGFFIGYHWEKNSFVLESVIVKTIERTDKPYEKIINEVYAGHVYSEAYNCVDFSQDLVKTLMERGYEAYYIKGDRININKGDEINPEWCNITEHNCRHAWVKLNLYIEATTGTILDPADYKETYVAD